MNDLVRHLQRAAYAPDGAHWSDAQLLAGFLSRRDEAAFEALVRRHGAMVLGVCRRLLREPADAEDAFQATFFVLLRKAASIRRRELLAGWLYGVAYRTALELRALNLRRHRRERPMHPLPEPGRNDPEPTADLRAVLDHELERLADKYRTAIVLCDLEGRSRSEAAALLRIP